MSEAMDRRNHERHNVSGIAWFHWKDAEGTKQKQKGNLRNVSAGGLFIETIHSPPVGTEIHIQCEFKRADRSPTASISAKGQVNRVEVGPLNDADGGFAVSTGRMNLHRFLDTADGEA
jgi:hypothetical protein